MSFDFLFERLGVFQHRELDSYTRLNKQGRDRRMSLFDGYMPSHQSLSDRYGRWTASCPTQCVDGG